MSAWSRQVFFEPLETLADAVQEVYLVMRIRIAYHLQQRAPTTSMSTIPATPLPGKTDRQAHFNALLDAFDPKAHGGEAMAFGPVGREFGSPNYEESNLGLGDAEAQ
jgi:hypothetical protein